LSASECESGLLAFAHRVGYSFHNLSLLQRALTHCSFQREHNERLEFLGDAVLQLVISSELFRRYSECSEGALTRMRARLVERAALLVTAHAWQLASLLRVSKGESGTDGLPRADSVIANGVEAVIGAVYVDGGYVAAEKLVRTTWLERLNGALDQPVIDAKTALQEWTQRQGMGLPEYHCDDLGVGCTPRFHASCQVEGRAWGTGRGGRKKDAEQQAAKGALERLMEQEGLDV